MAETGITTVGMSTAYGECEPVQIEDTPHHPSEEVPTDTEAPTQTGRSFLTGLEAGRLYQEGPVVLGSVAGTIEPNPGACLVMIMILIDVTLFQGIAYIKLPADTILLGIEQDREARQRVKRDLQKLGIAEGAVLAFSAFHARNLLRELNQPVSTAFVRELFRDMHRNFWTPAGLRELAKTTHEYCGRPGGGWGERFRELRRNPFRLPQWSPVPASKRVPSPPPEPVRWEVPEGTELTSLTVALAAAAALLKSLDLAIGEATGIILLAPDHFLVTQGDPDGA